MSRMTPGVVPVLVATFPTVYVVPAGKAAGAGAEVWAALTVAAEYTRFHLAASVVAVGLAALVC